MYHDKRFQKDPNFPFVAFSHEQMKRSTTKSFLLAEKKIFNEITERMLSIDSKTLDSLVERLSRMDGFKPENNEVFTLSH